MGEVFRKGPYVGRVYSDEQHHTDTPHVHVEWSDGSVSVGLAPIRILAETGRTAGRKRQILELVAEHLEACEEEWQRTQENP